MHLNPCFIGTFPKRQREEGRTHSARSVLILVLLEHSQRDGGGNRTKWKALRSLNPCFIGTFPKRFLWKTAKRRRTHGLNPCFIGTFPKSLTNIQTRNFTGVLILVLLEHSQRVAKPMVKPTAKCLNPCFIGTFPKR